MGVQDAGVADSPGGPVHRTIPPDEGVVPKRKAAEEYLAWRARTDLRAPYSLAPEFLQGTKPGAEFDTDEAPLIVFINARSGGRVGPELAGVLAKAVGSSQVFDLSEYRPDTVLKQIWKNLEKLEQQGNQRAAVVRSRLRILACGGDGTIAWILKVIQQLDLQPPPPVAIMPLGTGNDLSRSFHWGPAFEHGWIKGNASVYSTLKRVADARVSDLDSWRLRLLLPNSSLQPVKNYALTEVEQQQQDAVLRPGCAGEQHNVLMEGKFWNYFSVGADAQATYNFHHMRENHPNLAGSRMANQFWYSTFSCTSGWFCGTIPSVSSFSSVEVLQAGSSSWSTLVVPHTVKALVLVNLQSYAGGRNIWGEQQPKREGKWRQPSISDGLIEVVGFHSGYHAMAVMASNAKAANGKRLAQVSGIRLALRDSVVRPDGEPGQVFMQLDGEPWMQKVPAGNAADQVVLEVVHGGVSKVLRNTSDPDPSPEKKMAGLLGKQQAAAYLTASAGEAEAQAYEAHHDNKQQQQLEALTAVQEARGAVPVPASHVELPSAAHARTGAAAHAMLEPPARVAHTDGGAPCTSVDTTGVAAVAASASLNRLRCSLDMQQGGYVAEDGSCSSRTEGASPRTPSSAGTEQPSAVAVIEARSADGKKQVLGMRMEGPKGVEAMVLGKQMPQPAFVQLANVQAKQC